MKPLAFTKTFAMAAGALLSVTLVPVLMLAFTRGRILPGGLIGLYRPVIGAVLRAPLLTHHCDRFSQYCSIDYQAELKKHGILAAMSGKGNCHDNAMMERFFKTLKSELVWRTVFDTRQPADRAIGRDIDGFYNPLRRHSAPDFTSPSRFEKHAAE